jgi:hypothetical protein
MTARVSYSTVAWWRRHRPLSLPAEFRGRGRGPGVAERKVLLDWCGRTAGVQKRQRARPTSLWRVPNGVNSNYTLIQNPFSWITSLTCVTSGRMKIFSAKT